MFAQWRQMSLGLQKILLQLLLVHRSLLIFATTIKDLHRLVFSNPIPPHTNCLHQIPCLFLKSARFSFTRSTSIPIFFAVSHAKPIASSISMGFSYILVVLDKNRFLRDEWIPSQIPFIFEFGENCLLFCILQWRGCNKIASKLLKFEIIVLETKAVIVLTIGLISSIIL